MSRPCRRHLTTLTSQLTPCRHAAEQVQHHRLVATDVRTAGKDCHRQVGEWQVKQPSRRLLTALASHLTSSRHAAEQTQHRRAATEVRTAGEDCHRQVGKWLLNRPRGRLLTTLTSQLTPCRHAAEQVQHHRLASEVRSAGRGGTRGRRKYRAGRERLPEPQARGTRVGQESPGTRAKYAPWLWL